MVRLMEGLCIDMERAARNINKIEPYTPHFFTFRLKYSPVYSTKYLLEVTYSKGEGGVAYLDCPSIRRPSLSFSYSLRVFELGSVETHKQTNFQLEKLMIWLLIVIR